MRKKFQPMKLEVSGKKPKVSSGETFSCLVYKRKDYPLRKDSPLQNAKQSCL